MSDSSSAAAAPAAVATSPQTPVKVVPDSKSVEAFKGELAAALSITITFINGTGPVSNCSADSGESALAYRVLYAYVLR